MLLHQILILTLVATIGIHQVEANWNKEVYQVLKGHFGTFIQTYQNILSQHNSGNDHESYTFYNTWEYAVGAYLTETNFYEATRNYINKITGEFRISDVTDDTKTQIKNAMMTLCNHINSDKHTYMNEFKYKKLPLLRINDQPFSNICPSIDPKLNAEKNKISKRKSKQIEPIYGY